LFFPHKINVGKNLVVDPYYRYSLAFKNYKTADFFNSLNYPWNYALDYKKDLWIYFADPVDCDLFEHFFKNTYPETIKYNIMGGKIIV